ncbi:MAG: MFS transporter [Ignavibacteriaceae bacterium]|nr:MFS transporter [Ignavibacteriaceae bacterium]
MIEEKKAVRNPWAWVPSLYFAEGIPYTIVIVISGLFYKQMGLSNTEIALYTSWFYLPWVIKPLWSPFVDILKTKRIWIVLMQLIIGAGLGGLAFTIPLSNYFRYSILFFWLIAFSSATHDIAADGFYMLGLSQKDQSLFIGIRSLFYRLAMISGQGGLIVLAGYLQTRMQSIPKAWSYTFFVPALLFIILFIYHNFILPHPKIDTNVVVNKSKDFFITFVTFFKKENILLTLTFLLIYRLGESQLLMIAKLFLKDTVAKGGLGLPIEEIGIVYGTIGLIALICGGILGGYLASKGGLKKWIWWMFAAINIPHILYIYLAYAQPSNLFIINLCIAGEQFGYGFGFTAYMLYMIYVSEGSFKTVHYAICTGFMALGMMVPGMFSGWLQEALGYRHFFIWIFITMIPGYFIIRALKIDPDFGRKTDN